MWWLFVKREGPRGGEQGSSEGVWVFWDVTRDLRNFGVCQLGW